MTPPEIDIDALLAGAGTVPEPSAKRLLWQHKIHLGHEILARVARGEGFNREKVRDEIRDASEPWNRYIEWWARTRAPGSQL